MSPATPAWPDAWWSGAVARWRLRDAGGGIVASGESPIRDDWTFDVRFTVEGTVTVEYDVVFPPQVTPT